MRFVVIISLIALCISAYPEPVVITNRGKHMFRKFRIAAATLLLATVIVPVAVVAAETTIPIVLVHGMNMDGSVWEKVYEQLIMTHRVSIAQMPMTSIDDDVAAVRRAVKSFAEPVLLVAHSYGGMVITELDEVERIKGRVYIAAFQPLKGETLAGLNSSFPAKIPSDAALISDDGFVTIKPNVWMSYVANRLDEKTAYRTALFQRPVNSAHFGHALRHEAWRSSQNWAVVAAADQTVSPELQRDMYHRAGTNFVELDGGHLLPLSHSKEIAAFIERAAALLDAD